MVNKQGEAPATWSLGKWWLWAILGLLILYVLMLWFRWDTIEKDIQARTNAALIDAGHDWATADLDMRGRDVLLTGTAPSEAVQQKAIKIAQSVYGVRVVESDFSVAKARLDDAKVQEIVVNEQESINRCQDRLNQTIQGKKIEFVTGSAQLSEQSFLLLALITRVIKECEGDIGDSTVIDISGHTDDVGNDVNNLELSMDRAESVRRHLVAAGVFEFMVKAVGYGESRPIATNTTEEGRAQNRRIQFEIKQ